MLLQQCLPFTVLKLVYSHTAGLMLVATVLTVYGIETQIHYQDCLLEDRYSCNSAYRLRY